MGITYEGVYGRPFFYFKEVMINHKIKLRISIK